MNLGADDYLTKSVSSDDLIIAVNNVLNKKAKFDQIINKIKADISYILPHEIRTPLNGIIGFSQILYEDTDSFSVDEIKEISFNIYQSGKRILDLSENYIIFASLSIAVQNKKNRQALRKNQNFNTIDIIENNIYKFQD